MNHRRLTRGHILSQIDAKRTGLRELHIELNRAHERFHQAHERRGRKKGDKYEKALKNIDECVGLACSDLRVYERVLNKLERSAGRLPTIETIMLAVVTPMIFVAGVNEITSWALYNLDKMQGGAIAGGIAATMVMTKKTSMLDCGITLAAGVSSGAVVGAMLTTSGLLDTISIVTGTIVATVLVTRALLPKLIVRDFIVERLERLLPTKKSTDGWCLALAVLEGIEKRARTCVSAACSVMEPEK